MKRSQEITQQINQTDEVDEQNPYITCHRCHVVSKFEQTKPVYNTNGEENGERICNVCRIDDVRNTTKCPLQSCTTSLHRNQHFRTLPSKFYEIPNGHFRREVIDYFGISKDTKACCNLCYNKIAKASSLLARSCYNGAPSTEIQVRNALQDKTVYDIDSDTKSQSIGSEKYKIKSNLDKKLAVPGENYVVTDDDNAEKSDEYDLPNDETYEPPNGRKTILEPVISPPKTRLQSGKRFEITSPPKTQLHCNEILPAEPVKPQETIPISDSEPTTSPVKVKFVFKKRKRQETNNDKCITPDTINKDCIANETISLVETSSESEEEIVVINEKKACGNSSNSKRNSKSTTPQSEEGGSLRQKHIPHGDKTNNGGDSQSSVIEIIRHDNDIHMGHITCNDAATTQNCKFSFTIIIYIISVTTMK